MKRLLSIFSLLVTLVNSLNAITVSNLDYNTYNNSSYDLDLRVSGVVMAAGFASMYPTTTNYWRPVSRGGEGMVGWYQTEEEMWCLPFWADATTQIRLIYDSDDNGQYTSNQQYSAWLNVASATNSFYNGIAATNEGYDLSRINWLPTGNIIADTIDGTGGGLATARQNADTNLWKLFNPTIPVFSEWQLLANAGWVTDINGSRVLGFSTGSHAHQGGFVGSTLVRWKGMQLETNAASFTFNLTTLTAQTNNCAINGVINYGSAVAFNLRLDKLPPGWIENGGTITNQGSMCFQAMPSFTNAFNFVFRGTNFNATHNYSMTVNGVLSDQFTGAQFNAGRNWFTNMAGPIWAQRTNIINAYLDLYGIDHTTLVTTHSSGPGTLGVLDIPGFKSLGSTEYVTNNKRGSNYVNAMSATVQAMKAYDNAAYAAAQPVTYQVLITDDSYTPPGASKVGTLYYGH